MCLNREIQKIVYIGFEVFFTLRETDLELLVEDPGCEEVVTKN